MTLFRMPEMPPPLTTHGGTCYEPWTDGYAVGFRIVSPAGKVKYLYLNPSNDGGGIDETPDVFVYYGVNGDPSQDLAVHYYSTADEDDE